MIAHFTVADVLPASTDAFLRLSSRTYYLADRSTGHFGTASIATLRVLGATTNAAVPKSEAITVIRHDALAGPATLTPNTHLRITNSSNHSARDRYLVLTFEFTNHTKEPRLTRGQARLITVK